MSRLLILLLLLLPGPSLALLWEGPSTVGTVARKPVPKADVVERVTVAINYRRRSGTTRLNFRGTLLMPLAEGQAKVQNKQGYIEIKAEFRRVKPAILFGPEYLTYVLWAITPEGRAGNLGEILVKNGKGKLKVRTELQIFGLVVTAEPYFAVRQPSDLVVFENEVRPDNKGAVEVIDVNYNLLKRGNYKTLANPLSLTVDAKVPLQLYEARNAVQIAKSSGADRYEKELFLKAEQRLRQAEAYQAKDPGAEPVVLLAREAVQRAEDAREIAVRRWEEERVAAEHAAALRREREAKAAAEEQARLRAEQERLRRAREEAALEARRRAEQAEAERKRLEAELQQAKEAARKAQEDAHRAIALLKERSASFGQERARWEQDRTVESQESPDRSRRMARLEKAERRVRLYSQLSRVLFTRETGAGLVVEVPVEWFESGQAVLTPDGREGLALVAGILLANPGLVFRVLSQPEQAGGAARNKELYRGRAEAVRAYLAGRGLSEAKMEPQASSAVKPAPAPPREETPLESPVRVVISGPPIEVPPETPAAP